MKDLEGQPLVSFDPDLAIRKRIDAALNKHKVEARIVLEFDNIETLKQAIQVGSGVGILPAETVKQAVQVGVLAAVRFEPADLVRPVGIVYRKGKPLSAASLKFIETLIGHTFEGSGVIRPKETAIA
jgi:DNA-binding transcriptional LysR family regulator